MKKLGKVFAIELLALYFANEIASGLEFQFQLEGFLITAAALALASKIVRPVINILLLPLTLATLGVFKFLSHTVVLYLVDYGLQQFKITGFHFAGLTSNYVDLPAINYNEGIFAYLAFSLLISSMTGLFSWLSK